MAAKDVLYGAQSGATLFDFPSGLDSPKLEGPGITEPNIVFPDVFLSGESGGGGGGSQSTQATAILPPILELLAEMRARRESSQTAAQTLLNLVGGLAPQGAEFFPGLEPGGIGDIFAGFLAGSREEGADLIPESSRRPGFVDIPTGAFAGEPPVGSEFSSALNMARQILEAIAILEVGQATSFTSPTSARSFTQVREPGMTLEELQAVLAGEVAGAPGAPTSLEGLYEQIFGGVPPELSQ